MNSNNFRFIDLTHPLDTGAPTWDGSCGFCQEIRSDYKDGCRTQNLNMQAGVGTHLDAPSHFIANGMNVAEIPLEELIVPAFILNVTERAGREYLISEDDVINFEKEFGRISPKSLVIGYTGWSRFWTDPERYRNQKSDGRMHFPSFAKQAAELLLERGISGIGIDTLSPDVQDPAFPVHHLILGAGKYIIENLTNLENMPQKGAYVMALPLKTVQGTEAAVRAVGFIPK